MRVNFFENYYFTTTKINNLYFDITFSYILEMIIDLDKYKYPTKHLFLLNFLEKLILLSTFDDLKGFFNNSSFKIFLNILLDNIFDFE